MSKVAQSTSLNPADEGLSSSELSLSSHNQADDVDVSGKQGIEVHQVWIFNNIKTWTKKNARGVYEQVS